MPPEKVLPDMADVGGLVPAVVTSVDASTAVAWAHDVGPVEIGFESMEWAAPYIDENHRGDAPKGAGAQALQRTAYRAISPYRSPSSGQQLYPAFENLALHAIDAFGADTPRPVIDCLVQDFIAGDRRRAPAASEVLRIIASDEVLRALATVANAGQPVPDWIVATLGRLPPDRVRAALQDSPLLDRIALMLLAAQGAHWLASETIGTDIAFLLKQSLFRRADTCHRSVRCRRATPWARPYIDEKSRGDKPKDSGAVVKAGDVIRVRIAEGG